MLLYYAVAIRRIYRCGAMVVTYKIHHPHIQRFSEPYAPTPAENPTFDNHPPLCYEFSMTVEWEGKVHEIDRRLTVARLLDMFSLSKEAHLVAANGILATEDRMLERDDRVKIVRVISGG